MIDYDQIISEPEFKMKLQEFYKLIDAGQSVSDASRAAGIPFVLGQNYAIVHRREKGEEQMSQDVKATSESTEATASIEGRPGLDGKDGRPGLDNYTPDPSDPIVCNPAERLSLQIYEAEKRREQHLEEWNKRVGDQVIMAAIRSCDKVILDAAETLDSMISPSYPELESEIRSLQISLLDAKNKLNTALAERDEMENRIANLSDDSDAQQELKSANESIKELNRRIANYEDLTKKHSELMESNTRLREQLNTANGTIREMEEARPNYQSLIESNAKLVGERDEAIEQRDRALKDIEDIKNANESYEELADASKQLRHERNLYHTESNTWKKRSADLEREVDKLKITLSEYKEGKRHSEYVEVVVERDRLLGEVEKLKQSRVDVEDFIKRGVQSKYAEDAEAKANMLQATITKQAEEITSLKEALKRSESDREQLNLEIGQRMDTNTSLNEKLEVARNDAASLDKQLAECHSKRKVMLDQNDELTNQLREVRKDNDALKASNEELIEVNHKVNKMKDDMHGAAAKLMLALTDAEPPEDIISEMKRFTRRLEVSEIGGSITDAEFDNYRKDQMS